MVLLDTNVISELFKPAPNANVIPWIGAASGDALYTAATTRSE